MVYTVKRNSYSLSRIRKVVLLLLQTAGKYKAGTEQSHMAGNNGRLRYQSSTSFLLKY